MVGQCEIKFEDEDLVGGEWEGMSSKEARYRTQMLGSAVWRYDGNRSSINRAEGDSTLTAISSSLSSFSSSEASVQHCTSTRLNAGEERASSS